MAAKRVSILVSEETHAWLCAERDRLIAESERCGGYLHPAIREEPAGGKPPLSLEAVLLTLLDARQKHRERRRKAKLSRKGQRKRLPSKASLIASGALPPE